MLTISIKVFKGVGSIATLSLAYMDDGSTALSTASLGSLNLSLNRDATRSELNHLLYYLTTMPAGKQMLDPNKLYEHSGQEELISFNSLKFILDALPMPWRYSARGQESLVQSIDDADRVFEQSGALIY